MTQPRQQRDLDEELDRAAEITPDDIERARLAWERSASPEFKHLLDATPIDKSDPSAGGA